MIDKLLAMLTVLAGASMSVLDASIVDGAIRRMAARPVLSFIRGSRSGANSA
jgi:hypothetical protein